MQRPTYTLGMACSDNRGHRAGFAILHVDKCFTINEVVFAEPGDLLLLGARTLGGLNLTVDTARKKLVAAGPLLAA